MSQHDMSTSHGSKTTGASSTLYRPNVLENRGILFKMVPFPIDQLPEEVDASVTTYTRLPPRITFEEILDQQPFQDAVQIVTEAKGILAEIEVCLEDGGDEDRWTQRLWPKVYNSFYFERKFWQCSNANWNAAISAFKDATVRTHKFRVAGLSMPKPDIAFGLRAPLAPDEPYPLLSDPVLGALEDDAKLNLHPRPSPQSKPQFAYPGLVHEVKPTSGSPLFVENQLAKPLAFAMDQQEELREAAAAVDPTGEAANRNLPIIGVTSIGKKMTIFFATEGVNNKLCIVEYETLDLSQPRHICAAIMFVRSIGNWLKNTYRPRIIELLRVVYEDHLARRKAMLDDSGIYDT